MEVLQGNQPDPNLTRRRDDRRPGTDRTRHWTTRPSDILLQPHSPLALADVLSHGQGQLDLVAQSEQHTAQATDIDSADRDGSGRHAMAQDSADSRGPEASVVTSLQGRLKHRSPRERANLFTRHSASELTDRCRKSLVENALIKKPGQLQFYVIAGFLGFHNTTEDGRRELLHRAPLLFYPATLQHKPEPSHGPGDDGQHPARNPARTRSSDPASGPTSGPTSGIDTARTGGSRGNVTDLNRGSAHSRHDRVAETPSLNDVPPSPREQRHAHYEIHLNGAEPETNAVLVAVVKEQYGIELPGMDAHDTLQDYFSHIAGAIAGADDIELMFDMALGNASPPALERIVDEPGYCLPELPAHFNASLAMQITQRKTLPQLSAVLNLLRDYSDGPASTAGDTPASAERHDSTDAPALPGDAQSITSIHQLSRKLASNGLDHIEFQHFAKLPDNIDTWIDRVRQSLRGKLLSRTLDTTAITARQLVRLSGMIELIDKAPLFIEQYHHQDLCFHSSPALLRRARHQARLIEDELESLQAVFLLDKVPAKQQLLSLIEELGGTIAHVPDVVDADYFNARRQFMEFSVEKPANLNQEHRRLLGQLAKVLRFRELFINNIEYRMALGPGYRGLRTDWHTLEQMLEYCQELAEVLESESLAAAAMSNWSEFRQTYVQELDSLQLAGDATRRLLRVVGGNWQHRTIGELLDRARDSAQSIRDCNTEFGAMGSHGHRTAASVLAQFSGKSREDMLTEIHVDETESQIDCHLRTHDNANAQVLDTLAWLKEASALAVAFELGIDAIVGHLQIA